MAKPTGGGRFRTPVYIKKPPVERQPGGFVYSDIENAVNILDENKIVKCEWNAAPRNRSAYNKNYTSVAVTDGAVAEKEGVLIAVWYNKKITYGCLVFPLDEDMPYEITGITNVENKNRVMELQLKRVDIIG